MRVIDPLGVEWEVSRRRAGIGAHVGRSRRGASGASWPGASAAHGVPAGRRARSRRAFERGERSFSPAGAERVLPVSPLSSHEQRNVRVLP